MHGAVEGAATSESLVGIHVHAADPALRKCLARHSGLVDDVAASAFISEENKKNEVEELTENIALLYKKDMYGKNAVDYEKIDGLTILQVIEKLAHSKVKDYKSLTNKTVFKFMDMIEM